MGRAERVVVESGIVCLFWMTRSRYAIRRGQKEGRWGNLSFLLSVVGTAGYDKRRRREMYVERGRLREANDDVQCIRPRRLTRGRERGRRIPKRKSESEESERETHTHTLPLPLPLCPPCAARRSWPSSSSRTRVSFHSLSPRYPAHQKKHIPRICIQETTKSYLRYPRQYPTSRTSDHLSPCKFSCTYCTPPHINWSLCFFTMPSGTDTRSDCAIPPA